MLNTMKDVQRFFESRKKLGIKPGLDRVHFMLEQLGNPEKNIYTIHVAGTNGKGSTIQFMNDALIENGYKVGVFTSPSFTGIKGYIRLNGEEIAEEQLLFYLHQILPIVERLDALRNHPTEFEIITVLAILFFSEKVEIALIEAGMGGREDTTNVVESIISVITNISMDHMNYLGSSIEEITYHKAGIIKTKRSVVIGKVTEESRNIILQVSSQKSAPIFEFNNHFTYVEDSNGYKWISFGDEEIYFKLQMRGIHQVENASVAMMVLYLLKRQGFKIDWNLVKTSFQRTQLPGRFEQVANDPIIILDSAHNFAGIKSFVHTVQNQFPHKEKYLLFAGFKDKQIQEMLKLLKGNFSDITLTTFNHERAASLEQIEHVAASYGMNFISSWEEKIDEIFLKKHEKIFFVTGSLHFIIQVRKYILNK